MKITPLLDADMLAALHATGFDRPWSAQAFEDLLQKPTTRAFGHKDGFILLQALDEAWEILTLAIAPMARRQGLAWALLMHVSALAAPADIWLDVAEDNAAARALYLACGFVETGRRPNYYKTAADKITGQTRSDALLMKKTGARG